MANWNYIDYWTITSDANASDFGNMTANSRYCGATDNGTNGRGVCFGGADNGRAAIDYITISSTGNAQDFGDLINSYTAMMAGACSNSTNDRGISGGGGGNVNHIQYITITSTGNGTDFGDLTVGRNVVAAVSNGTRERAVFGSSNPAGVARKTMDYITINSAGNATDFGDMNEDSHAMAGCSNSGT
jgi:hypothetical protein